MKNVKMTVPMSGPRVSRQRGDVIEVNNKEAENLIKAGFAVLFVEAPINTPPTPDNSAKTEPGKETAMKTDPDKDTATKTDK